MPEHIFERGAWDRGGELLVSMTVPNNGVVGVGGQGRGP